MNAEAALAREGAESVFRYVDRTAETVPEGVRWETIDYENRPQYDGSAFNGVGGIPLFLADYYRLTKDGRALDLARGGAEWTTSFYAARRARPNASLCFGSSIAGLAWLLIAAASGDTALVSKAEHVATWIAPVGSRGVPHGVADFLGGAAGEGIFLLKLWEATRNQEWLDGAAERARWLAERAQQVDGGYLWPWHLDRADARIMLGFAHGITGIGHFFLLLHQATGEPQWADVARGVANATLRSAFADRDGLNWPYVPGGSMPPGQEPPCRWCHGAPGIGLFFAKGYEVLRDEHYLETAKAAGETTFAYGDVRGNPCQCHGLAGNAELFVELYRLTREPLWLERAHDFARQCLTYRTQGPDGDTWQADEPGYSSPDFQCGASGTGHFFLRLLAPDDVRMPLQ